MNPYLQAGGRRFESDYLHPIKSSTYGNVGAFLFAAGCEKGVKSAFYNVSFMLL